MPNSSLDELSKRSLKKYRTGQQITRCAQRLAAQVGYDEFTMDDLAQAAGVSRRTLFNYFSTKLDAVLGDGPRIMPETLATFVQGGPSGDLLQDSLVVMTEVLEDKDLDRESAAILADCLDRNPKLTHAALLRVKEMVQEFANVMGERENLPGNHPRVMVLMSILVALMELSMHQFVEDEQHRPFSEFLAQNLEFAHDLLARQTTAIHA